MTDKDTQVGADSGDALGTSHVSRRRAIVGGAVTAAVVAVAGFAVYRERHTFADALGRVGGLAFAGSFAMGVLGVGLTFPAWREVLRGLRAPIPAPAGARVFFISQLGKYLPGSVWPVLMQMEIGRARGVPRRTMLAANLLTLTLGTAVGLIIAAILLPASNSAALHRYWWTLLAVPLLLALLHPRAIPWVLDRALALGGRPPVELRLPVRASAKAAAWSAASFLALGLHVAVLSMAIDGFQFSTVVLCIGGIALAVPLGVLFVPAPAGAGVRDAVLALVLTVTLKSGEALAVAVASRGLLVAADLLLASLAASTLRRSNDGPIG